MNASQIIDLLGGIDSWADVYAWFGKMDESEVLDELNRVYPGDDNENLASSIAYGCHWYGEEGPHPQAEF